MVPASSERDVEKFLMHDLVNDLAQIASSKLCIRLEENEGSHMLEQSRHIQGGDFEKLKPLSESEQLRTLLPVSIYNSSISKRVLHNILPRLTSLRALSLSGYAIVELPNHLFINLKLLRFLDISRTEIKRLPDSICVLYNLETLLLSSCDYLEDLPLQMEKLINLHHLDISNTSLLKMPLHLSKLKSIHVLVGAKYLPGGSDGSLSILELQNVVDRKEAVKANTRAKNHVEKSYLEWSESSADNSQTKRDILDELCPHTNIKEVKITGYKGTKFPNWLADNSFLNLVKLSLVNCKDCDSLPALGQLPSLKFLSIREMHRITEVTEEFFGSLSSKNSFNYLEELEFEDILEWKNWHILGSIEFPKLGKLSIKNCQKLMGKLPENLSSLTELRISTCPQLILETPIQRSSLKRFEVIGSPKVEVLFDDVELFLEYLILQECDSISPELVPSARYLGVESCPNLTMILIPAETENLSIWNCGNVEKLSVACGGSQITYLEIRNCLKLKWLPERLQQLLPSLKDLTRENCPEIESFPEGGLPFKLQLLEIINCKKLVNGRKEWRLQKLPCLTELVIEHDSSDEEMEHWELPCSITGLTISNMITISSQVLESLTSLELLSTCNLTQIQSLLEQGWLCSSLSELRLHHHHELYSLGLRNLTSLLRLHINNCPNLQSLSESALPSSLSVLTIHDCPKFQSLPVKEIPSSLSVLNIRNCNNFQSLLHLHVSDCPNLQSLSESALPSSLSKLTVGNCHNLQSLSESALPSSLSVLTLLDCPNLQSLPVKGMPSSLSKLSIFRYPLLKPLLEFDKGEYWPNIAQIPIIHIDREYL